MFSLQSVFLDMHTNPPPSVRLYKKRSIILQTSHGLMAVCYCSLSASHCRSWDRTIFHEAQVDPKHRPVATSTFFSAVARIFHPTSEASMPASVGMNFGCRYRRWPFISSSSLLICFSSPFYPPSDPLLGFARSCSLALSSAVYHKSKLLLCCYIITS